MSGVKIYKIANIDLNQPPLGQGTTCHNEAKHKQDKS